MKIKQLEEIGLSTVPKPRAIFSGFLFFLNSTPQSEG